jgi:hypothetical protein
LVVAAGSAVPHDAGSGFGGAVGGGEGGVEAVAVDDGVVPFAQQGGVGQVGVPAVDPVS